MPSTTTTLLNTSDKLLDVTPDGQFASYVETSGDNQSLYVINVNTGQKSLVDTYTSFTYVFHDQTGVDALFNSQTGFDGGVLSPDGTYIYYSTGVTGRNISNNPGDTRFYVKDIANGTPPVDITPSEPTGLNNVIQMIPLAVGNDGLTFVYGAYDKENPAVTSQSSDGDGIFVETPGGVRTIIAYESGYGNEIQLTPDGRYLTYSGYYGLVALDLTANTSTTYGASTIGDFKSGAISNDGRYVVYSALSAAGDEELYVHDNAATTVPDQLVSASANGVAANGGDTVFSALSGDGRHVLFVSDATNLVATATDGSSNLYVKNLDSGAISIVAANIAPPGYSSYLIYTNKVFISDDGSRVIYADLAGDVVLKQFTPPTLTLDEIDGTNVLNAASSALVIVTGTSDAIGGTVHVSVPGASLATYSPVDAIVGSNGHWTATLALGDVGDGHFDVLATVTDELSSTAEQPLIIDRTPPVATITSVAGDNIINAAELTHATITGTLLVADPGGTGSVVGAAQLTIDGGVLVDNFQSSASANTDPQTFSQVLDATGVKDGEHIITLTVTDEAGNKTVVTKQVLVDTTPPKIAIASVSDDNVVGVAEVKSPQVVAGASDAIGQTVNVLVDGVQAGQAVVQADGKWQTTVSFASASTGEHDVTAVVNDEAGNPGRTDVGVYVDQGFSTPQLSDGPNGEQGGGQGVMFPGLTADGTKLVFTGLNFNLMSSLYGAATGSSGAQVYIKDLTTGAITFATPDPSQNAEFGAISPDGRYVEFVSNAPIDSNYGYYLPGYYFTYTKDLTTGATYFHYSGETSKDGTNPDTFVPGISAGYYSLGDYPDGPPIAPLPVFPLAIANGGGALELVSDLEPVQVVQPLVLTTLIRETSLSSNLVNGAPTSFSGGGEAYLAPNASPPIENIYGRYISQEYAPAISADGSVVAFEARFYPEQFDTSTYPPRNTVGPATVPEIYAGAYTPDLSSETAPPIALASSFSDGTPMPLGAVDPALSADGKFVAFWSWGKDGALQVFEKNLTTGALNVVSSDALGNPGVNNAAGAFVGGFNTIAISADGRYVAFTSDAVLTPDDSGAGADLFLKDMQTGAITRAPLPSGTFNPNLDNQLTMRADGQYVAFVTSASLSAMDENNTADIYGLSFATLGTPPKVAIDAVTGDNRLDASEISHHLTISGTSDAIGQSVSLFVDGSMAFSATVAGDGTWVGSIDATFLIDGAHQLRATATDATGATGSAGDLLTVARVAPKVAFAAKPQVMGVGAPGAAVTLKGAYQDVLGVFQIEIFNGAQDLGAATLDGAGGWSLNATLAPGSLGALSVVATDAGGNLLTTSAPFALGVAGNVVTQTNSDGSKVISRFNVTGQSYTTVVRSLDEAGDLIAVEHEGITGAPYIGDKTLYSGPGTTGNIVSGNHLFYVNQVSGLAEVDLDGGGNLTRALYAYSGTSPGTQTGFEADYVAGQFTGGVAPYLAPAGATYSTFAVEYDNNYQYVGAVYTFNYTGQTYDEAQYSYSAGAQPKLTEATFSGYTGTGGPSVASFFYDNSGASTGVQYSYSGITGQAYTSDTLLYNAANVLIAAERGGYTAKPFSSQTTFYNGSGVAQEIVRDFTSPASSGAINGQAYNAYETILNPAFTLLATAYHLDNGGNIYVGVASGATSPVFGGTGVNANAAELSNTLTGGDWTITGGGTGETFNFAAFFNKAEITDYGTAFGGATDVISVSTQDFADWTTMLADAAPSGGGANTTFTSTTTGDKLTLDGVTVAQLTALTPSQASADFVFHA